MSCRNATAPLDITGNSVEACSLKCDYTFTYPTTSLSITNRGDYFSMRVDPNNVSPVTYNAANYQVQEIRLYHSSLHTYAGSKADAELIIVHNSVTGSGNLLVCVPIMKTTVLNESAKIFDTLISELAKTANSVGQQTVVNIHTFSLDKLVPMKPFFSYTGTLPYSPCNGEYSYIVFGQNDALGITSAALKSFKKIISVNQYTTPHSKRDHKIYYNSQGPKSQKNSTADEYYMSCAPTGGDGEVLIENVKSTESLFDSYTGKGVNKFLSGFIQIIIAFIIILIILSIGHKILNYIGKKQAGGAVSATTVGGRLKR